MKEYSYKIYFTIIDKHGLEETREDIVYAHNANAHTTVRKQLLDKYRGRGYNVQIHTVVELGKLRNTS